MAPTYAAGVARFETTAPPWSILGSVLFDDWGATPAERAEPLPGDDLIPGAPVAATRSISLAADADTVFAWLAQMGFGRGGWYSYDLLDNLGRRSATRLEPAWQVAAAGDTVPGGPISFEVTHLSRPDHLVLAVLGQRLAGHTIDFSLAYRLRSIDRPERTGPGTRLVSRARIRVAGPLGRPATAALGAGDGVMVRRQLLGLAERCGRIEEPFSTGPHPGP